MSDNTSQNSPMSSHAWTSPIDYYDGAIDIEKNWREGLRPDPFLEVSQWSDQYRVLSPKSAAEPGRWRTERTPYLQEIMDCLSVSSPVQRVVFMKGAQVGGTEVGNNWIGYVIHIAPGPMMAVSPTVEMARRNSRQRIDPQIEDVPALRERVAPARSRDSGNTVLSKEFPGGVLVMTGANSAVGLRSMPARYLFMDEVDGYPGDVEGEEEEFEAPEWERLYERREKYPIGVVPQQGLFLTAGVDVQRDRLECEVVAWGRNKISWSVDYQILDGDTAQTEVWQKLDDLLAKDWPHAAGGTLPIRVMCVDSGYATQDVYAWVRTHPQAVWGGAGARASQPRTAVAIKGRDQDTALILSVSKADTGGKRKGLRVWNVSGPVAKVELYRWLKLPRPTDEALATGEDYPPGSCHYPEYGEEYFKQLTAERRVIRLHKGFPKATWEKDPARNNEALDCRVYARAAASIYGLDRFKEIHWKRLEQALGVNLAMNDQPSHKTSIEKTAKTRSRLTQRASTVVDDPYL